MEQREARRKNGEMAGRRVYGGSDMPALLHKELITTHALEALLAAAASSSASPHAGFDGSGSILNFEGARANAMNQQFYRRLEAEEAGDVDVEDAGLHQPEKKRRLTADKVQFLEKSFELDIKLEPVRKVQLAKDLDLQPRQVAIWFQNRRARWRTKQLEKDYEALESNYNALKMDYEDLQKEKEKLKAEVIFLADKVAVKEKEEEGGAIEAAQCKNSEGIDSGIGAKDSKTQMMGVKQEELSSANDSTIFDCESPPHCLDGGQNWLSSEAAASSSAEDEEVGGYHQLLKLEDNSHNFAFPVEDQALWFWPNC